MAKCTRLECPAGQYMNETEGKSHCASCPLGQFTETCNSLLKCRVCEQCSKDNHLQTSRDCSLSQNTQCVCQDGYYCIDKRSDSCNHCTKRTECHPGMGADNRDKGKDTTCAPCLDGFFSNVTDYYSPCHPHTRCGEREVLKEGTNKSDTVCGKCPFPPHHWMLPAGLWAGLIISVIIIIAAYVYWKTKRQSRCTVTDVSDGVLSLSPVHVPAPDILPPALEGFKKEFDETQPIFRAAVETSSISCDCSMGTEHNTPLMSASDCTIECDGPTSPTVASPTSPMRLTPLAAACGPPTDSIGYSVCHSEPQEDEWNGA